MGTGQLKNHDNNRRHAERAALVLGCFHGLEKDIHGCDLKYSKGYKLRYNYGLVVFNAVGYKPV